MNYSQNNEQEIILEYFKGRTGHLLDVGANDGITFSNSLALIERGWLADLVEPSSIPFKKAIQLHADNRWVKLYNCAISNEIGTAILHDSGTHLHKGDHGLLSSLKESETKKWKAEKFEQVEVRTASLYEIWTKAGYPTWNFITIDAEGMDYDILKQITPEMEVEMICVEHNGIETEKYISFCRGLGMNLLMKNQENIIMAL